MDGSLRRILLGAFLVGLAVSITLAQTALALLAIRWLHRLATGRARGGWPLAWPFGAFALASLLAAALSPRVLESLGAARGLLLILTFYVVRDALDDLPAADRFLTTLLALAAAVAVVGLLQVALCPWIPPASGALGKVLGKCHRARGFYSIYMTLAGVLSLVLLATLPRVLPARRSAGEPAAGRAEIWAWLVAGAAFALTYVRGAWLGFLAGAVVVIGLVRHGRRLVLIGVLLLVALVALVPGLRQRAESIADPADPTARDRWSMWASGIAMARDHPLTGAGPGQVKHEYRRYARPDALQRSRGHLHNTPLQILVERGVLGLAAWLSIFAVYAWQAACRLRALAAADLAGARIVVGSLAAVVGFLVGGLTEYNFGDSEVVMVAYAVMALPFVSDQPDAC